MTGGSILVGYGPEARGRGGLELGRMLARSSGLPLVISCVIPDRWQPLGPGRQVDHDYAAYLHQLAEGALAQARELVDGEATFVVDTARSVPAGLVESAKRYAAQLIVTGSSADGSWGHVALGSVSDRLLHSSTLPVALAPRGFRVSADQHVTRLSVAVDGTETTTGLLARAAAVARQTGAQLRLVTFAVRHGTMYPPETGLHLEERVIAAWQQEVTAALDRAVDDLGLPLVRDAERVVAQAPTWAAALDEPDWHAGDLLVVGSSHLESAMVRVFLGSTATRIIRHSPVPIVVVP